MNNTFFITIQALEWTKENLDKTHNECQQDPNTKLSDDFLNKIRNGEEAEDPNEKAHTMCMAPKLGFVDADGKLIKDEVRKGLALYIKDEDELEKAYADCAVDKEDPEDTPRYVWKCTTRHAVKYFHQIY